LTRCIDHVGADRHSQLHARFAGSLLQRLHLPRALAVIGVVVITYAATLVLFKSWRAK
jgi:hypothetical protein